MEKGSLIKKTFFASIIVLIVTFSVFVIMHHIKIKGSFFIHDALWPNIALTCLFSAALFFLVMLNRMGREKKRRLDD